MLKLSRTYRLIAVLTALLVLVGVTSPASVYAWAGHCDMQMETTANEAGHHQSNEMQHNADDHGHAMSDAGTDDCTTGVTCECCVTQSVIKTRSAHSFNRVKADLSPAVLELIEPTPQPEIATTSHTTQQYDAGDASPPIFLKNSTFLN